MGIKRRSKFYRDIVSMGFRGITNSFKNNPQASGQRIDVVVTWVDGNDPVWQADREYYLNMTDSNKKAGNGICRYRDWDFFRYWFRAIEKYASWVNRVFFITYGHVPSWLDTKSPKLCIVRHEDFIPKEYLPTFSSIPIELNLHRIPGLSEHFIYFNDDIFLARPSSPEDFFVNGKPVLCPAPVPLSIYRNEVPLHIMCSTYAEINSNNIISSSIMNHAELWFSWKNRQNYKYICKAYRDDKLPGMYFSHMGVPFTKQTMEQAWKKYPSIAETCTHKFRTPMDVMHYIFTAEDLLNGNFSPCDVNHYGKIINMKNYDLIKQIYRDEDTLMICFNDSNAFSDSQVIEINEQISRIFQEKFPEKSQFEK